LYVYLHIARVLYVMLPVYGPNFSKVSYMSGSALDWGLGSRLIRNVFVDGSTGSAAILKCSSIEVHDE
jgi:hypothetical protein